MKVYIIDQKNRDQYIKIYKKKISYDGILDVMKSKSRFENTKEKKERKRRRKHAFRNHVKHF